MRIQDKIQGHRIAKRKSAEGRRLDLSRGVKVDDELPVPHHSGCVVAPSDQQPLRSHQKQTD
jgi:NADH-quinone oxidoreductase subunit B